MPPDPLLLAQIAFHRKLERAHGEYAQSLAASAGEDMLELPALRGTLQPRIAALPRMATIEGMTGSQVGAELDHDVSNVHTALKGLNRAGTVELVPNSNPQRWRLTETQRRNRVLRLSRLIPSGRWTTYGEFAIAVYGSPRMARSIGQAAKNPAFTNPHRVLHAGGVVDDEWRDESGRGPEHCKGRLAEEGVWLATDDAADPQRLLNWEELVGLLEAAEPDDDLDQAA